MALAAPWLRAIAPLNTKSEASEDPGKASEGWVCMIPERNHAVPPLQLRGRVVDGQKTI